MRINVDNKLSKIKLLKLLKTWKLAKLKLGFLTANTKKIFFELRQTFTKAVVLQHFRSK